jgi:glutaredoxin
MTFPMVFYQGRFIGGSSDFERALQHHRL